MSNEDQVDEEQHSVQLFPVVENPTARYVPGSPPLFGRTLRVALAMRGGVSLAVWIGGAVGELDLLRRIRWTADGDCFFLWRSDELPGVDEQVIKRARVYAEALRAKGYDCAEFDVLAGASAGGLNSILYSVAQRVGARLDGVLNVWITAGAFWKLMRNPGLLGHDSPLNGDGFFAPGVLEALKVLYSDRKAQVATHRASHLVVDLSATVIDTEDARDRSSSQGRAQFHFVGADHSDPAQETRATAKELGRAIPDGAGDGPGEVAEVPLAAEISLARLAYSARTTSSLPGGFEPALIYSSFSPTADNTNKRIDMSYAFHVHRQGFDAPYRVVDGGLTDNIPIDRAFRAIRSMASEVYSDRVIMYLDPDPPVRTQVRTPHDYSGDAASQILEGAVPTRTDPSSRLLKVVSRALGIRVGKESAEDKAGEIDAYRRNLLLASGRGRSITPLSLAARADAAYDRTLALQEYAQYRIASDSNLLLRVLQDPAVWQLGTDLPTRDSFAALVPSDLADLDAEMWLAYAASSRTPLELDNAIFAGPIAIADSCLSLLAWVRALEDAYFTIAGSTQFIDRLAPPEPTLATVRTVLYNALDEATRERDLVVRDVCRGVLQYNTRVEPFDPAEIAARATGLMLVDPSARMLALRDQLNTMAEALRGLTNAADAPLAGTLWAGLPASDGATAMDVAALCAAAGIPESIADVRFWEITAAAPVPDVTKFPVLRADDFRLTLASILALGRPEDVDATEVGRLVGEHPLTANAKLNGTAIGAFAGFLSADWRRNDWLWGRLDAASGILGFLASVTTPAGVGLRKFESTVPPERAVADTQDAILKEASLVQISQSTSRLPGHVRSKFAPFAPLPGADAMPDDLRHKLVIGADALTYLNPGYRVGVASRVIHLVFGSFGRPASGAWTLLVTAILRPISTFLPAVVDPPRLLLVGSLLTALWTVSSVEGTHTTQLVASFRPPDHAINVVKDWGWWALPILAALVLGLGIWSALVTHRRWANIRRQLTDASVQASVKRYYQRATVTGIVLLAVSVVLMFLTLWANQHGWITWASTIAGMIAGVALVLIAMLRFGAVTAKSGYPVRDSVILFWACLVFVVFVTYPGVFAAGAITMAQWLHTMRILGTDDGYINVQHLPVVVGFFALVLALVMHWGWIAGRLPAPSTASRGVQGTMIVVSWVQWAVEAIVAGVVGYFACAGMLLVTQLPDSHPVRAVCVLVALCFSGTAQYALSQIPTWYQPSDSTKRPKVT